MIWDFLVIITLAVSPSLSGILKREVHKCRKSQWQCRDGSCIQNFGKCDGVVDCPDGSDETHPLCRNTPCNENFFRCTYGACVDGTAPCNGEKECADGSDELLPQCFNRTRTVKNKFTCTNGHQISAMELCDGARDCADGSDEALEACAGWACPQNLFQCANGACVDEGSDCNRIQDCADNSDESDELCDRMSVVTTAVVTTPQPAPTTTAVLGSLMCPLPPYPEHGRYQVMGDSRMVPGMLFTQVVALNSTCDPGYALKNPVLMLLCQGVDLDGPKCEQCGKVTPEGQPYAIGGKRVRHGELPWHAAIYRRNNTEYEQKCGGSLVNTKTIISAAHCFWGEKGQQPAENYAVALGKIYRPWDGVHDKDAQFSNITTIHIPEKYQDSSTNYQQDIAVLVLEKEIQYQPYIRPVCVDFTDTYRSLQLQNGNKGKVAGWGRTAEDGQPSPVLLSVEMPFVSYNVCFAETPIDFRQFLAADKFCAGYTNGAAALCQGDSGGGLVFPLEEPLSQRYYLRGIVSVAPRPSGIKECEANVRTSFTDLHYHEAFIKDLVQLD